MSTASTGGVTLEQLVEQWLADLVGQVDPETAGLYRLHFTAHLIPHFRTLEAITTASVADYGRQRLRVVKRATVDKERSTLRGFLAWCVERGHLPELLDLPPLPRRARGTAYAVRRRGAATELSPEECRAVIATLPEWSTARQGRPAFPVRSRFVVAFETSLRPATLDALSVPEHYTAGATKLHLTDEIDKARFGREVPLTDRAREALASVAGQRGLIFGDHDYRNHLEKAAKAVLTPRQARTFTGYDFRHARLTELAETSLLGAAYMAGHKRVSTTAIYVRPGLRQAQHALGVSASKDGAEAARHLARKTHAELRALEPPADVEAMRAEWQALVNLRAEALEATERTDAAEVLGDQERRRWSPQGDTELDELVLLTIAQGQFMSQLQLRAVIGCSLSRLRSSLERLTQSRRITRGSPHSKLERPVWRVALQAA